MSRAALTAAAQLCVEHAGGRQRLRWSQAWPVLMRATGPDRVHLVHGAGGPLGGDAFSLAVQVGPGAALRLRSAAVTLVQPAAPAGAGPASWDASARVAPGGLLDWAPEATVVCAGAAIESRLRVQLDPGAGAVLRELAVLGRHGERGGRYRGELRVDMAGQPLLAHTTLLDGADDVLCGPGGPAGSRAVGTLVLAGAAGATPFGGEPVGEGPGVRWAGSALAGPGRIVVAVGEPGPVAAVLDAHVAGLGVRRAG